MIDEDGAFPRHRQSSPQIGIGVDSDHSKARRLGIRVLQRRTPMEKRSKIPHLHLVAPLKQIRYAKLFEVSFKQRLIEQKYYAWAVLAHINPFGEWQLEQRTVPRSVYTHGQR